MRQFQFYILIVFSILTVNCQQNAKKKTVNKVVVQSRISVLDSLTIDLVTLQKQGKLTKTEVITVQDDPVYNSVKRFNAFSFPELLKTYSVIKNLDINKYQIVFECEDGYKPMMPLAKFLSVKSFIAISDVDAPKGKLWSEIIKEGHPMKAAPFYLIYEGVSPKDESFKWPYNIVKIHFVTTSSTIAALFPKDDKKAEIGFELFKKNCVTCHAINKIGGNMGPELNYPKSVTEYWNKNQLKEFIKNPASFRNGVKMPTPTNVSKKEIDDIIVYLNYMASHKL